MTLEQADRLFSKRGFCLQILPYIVLACAPLIALVFAGLGSSLNWLTGALGAVLIVLALGGSLAAAFRRSSRDHAEMKLKYGKAYSDALADGRIPLSPHTVLMIGSPGSFEAVLKRRRQDS